MIGIIGAMDVEVDFLKNNLKEYKRISIAGSLYYSGKIGENNVVVTKCGVGKVNASIAATILIMKFGCDKIINTGIAGGAALTKPKDIVIPTKFAYSDVDVTCFGYELGQIPGSPLFYTPDDNLLIEAKKALQSLGLPYKCGTVLTADKFVSKKAEYEKMHIDDVMACEMEGGAIAQTCMKLKTSFIAIRYISDQIEEESQIADYSAFETEMALMSAKVCYQIVEKINY